MRVVKGTGGREGCGREILLLGFVAVGSGLLVL